MAVQNQGSNVDLFDTYFRRADLDRDGRISGAEAVSFFQGSNLPKPVLYQIWTHADQARTGFLGRAEFYNALKLVTVAQSKRELTPDIVKAALYGPAAAKIPAPQINHAATQAPQINPMAAGPPAPQIGAVAPTPSQNLPFRGQTPQNSSMNQNFFPPQGNQYMRPPQPMPTSTASIPARGVSRPEYQMGGSVGGPGFSIGPTTQAPNRGISPLIPATSSQTATRDFKVSAASGNGFSSDPVFGGDLFSANLSLQKQDSSVPTYFSNSAPAASSATVPVSSGSQSLAKPNPLDSLQSAFTRQPGAGGQLQQLGAGGRLQQTPPLVRQNQQIPAQSTNSHVSPGISTGPGHSTPSQQLNWPKMKPSDVQKYTKVFMEVDKDRDGKITGEEARNLFLSWRLPREVLMQVWDLSDQDNDSMLSLREFCTALYLMERYREGRPLPAVLPSGILLDETPNAAYGNAAWGATPGLRQQQGLPGVRPPLPGMRPPLPGASLLAGGMQPNHVASRMLMPENHQVNQLSNGDQNSLNSKFQEAPDAEKKVEGTEKLVILDSREKVEFYRTKMQDLVLYKSRCDNRLNEITERASADKQEAELLGKKYEEKYKQVAEIASKLTIEDARCRDIQERKKELHQAIVKMQQGGSADGILQVRADRIQSDLEELIKALTERCKKHGINVHSTAVVELPNGWEPGIQEGTADWDEDWDKFEDEGFSFFTIDTQNGATPPKQNYTSVQDEKASPDSPSHDEKPFSKGEHSLESESAYAHSEDDPARSPSGSPSERNSIERRSQEFPDVHFEKSLKADSERHGSFDESTWGAFDNNDDVDSVWGFNPANNKDSDHDRNIENYFFGSGDSGSYPTRTDSPQADSGFHNKSPFNFADSVPSSPMSKSGHSFSDRSGNHFFDESSRFDSFSMHEGRYSPPRENLARFDSMSSTRDFHSREFTSFDDSDPFGSMGPFKVSSETSKKNSTNWNAF